MKNRDEERKMRLRLKFHFMNPFQKWKYNKRRRFPFKLGFQLVAIILVTAQVCVVCVVCGVVWCVGVSGWVYEFNRVRIHIYIYISIHVCTVYSVV